MLRQRGVTAATVLDVLLGIAPLQPGLDRDDAVETLWVLIDPAVFDRLVRQRGWSLDRYQRWLAAAVRALLVPHPDPVHPPLPEEIPGASPAPSTGTGRSGTSSSRPSTSPAPGPSTPRSSAGPSTPGAASRRPG